MMEKTKQKKNFNISRLTESAMMIAIATLLSMAKLIDMPYGGSVTMASMLPLVILAYRRGLGWGLLSGIAYGAIQFALGTENIGYLPAKSIVYVTVMILADYLLAFAALGFGGIFRKACKRQATALALGSVLVALLRFACHVVGGWTVWASFDLSKAGLIYSLSYNASYMIPEMLILVVAALFIGNLLDFRSSDVRAMAKEERSDASGGLLMAGLALMAFGLSFAVVEIFKNAQNAETGEFSKEGIAGANWLLVGIVAAVCFAAAIGLLILRKRLKTSKKEQREETEDAEAQKEQNEE